MSEIALSVENISKRYIIGHQRDQRDALRHVLQNALQNPWQWFQRRRLEAKTAREEFWALKDVSFEVKQGDAVGVIGRNGAGKSTLLKILSRITEPTTGRIVFNGRVASLLEVGTGFHQDLTGRENIYLNGAILGMGRSEIRRKFDEIVDFSEVAKFLDTPVKRYSSGMYVRLAFAVAAHLEPEILIVDEVLAVGDAAFQKKCLGKMGDAAKGGRTILFVSHNMSAVQALCNQAIYLSSGLIRAVGDTNLLVNQYMADVAEHGGDRLVKSIDIGDEVMLTDLELSPTPVEVGGRFKFLIRICAKKETRLNELAMLVYSSYGTRVANLNFRRYGLPRTVKKGEETCLQGEIDSLNLVEGEYSVGIHVNVGLYAGDVTDLARFSVSAHDIQQDVAHCPVQYRGIVNFQFAAEFVASPSSMPLEDGQNILGDHSQASHKGMNLSDTIQADEC